MKIGDTVRILKGDKLVRVGYAETLESAREKLNTECIYKHRLTPEQLLLNAFPFLQHRTTVLTDEITKIYNKHVLKFGGSKKSVYLTHDASLDGRVAVIVNWFTKHTGDYVPADSECSAYLTNRQVRTFYRLSLLDNNSYMVNPLWSSIYINSDRYGISIEAHNLELIRSA